MSNLRRGVVATVAALAAVSLLAGCGEDKENSNFGPVQNVEYNPVNGISLDSTIVKVRDLYVLADEGVLPPRLRVSLINTTNVDDQLVGATIGRPAVTGSLLRGTNGVLPVNSGTSVYVGSVAAAGPQVTFPGFKAKAGTWVPVTLLFAKGRAVAGSVLVQSAVSLYSDGTVPRGRSVNDPTQSVLPAGEAENPAAEEAQVQQGENDQSKLDPVNQGEQAVESAEAHSSGH